jgi:cytochrome P450
MSVLVSADFDPRTDVFNPAAPEVIRNPYPWFDVLRESDPVHAGVQGMRFLTRYADVDRVLRDHRTFVRGRFSEILSENFGDNSLDDVMSKFMFALDPPDHTRLRKLVNHSFTTRKMERLRPRMREIANELLDDALADGPESIDVIDQFAYPLPLQIVCEILGVPSEDRELLRTWTCDITPTVDVAISKEVKARGIEAAALFKGYFTALISQRRRERGDDLLSELLDAEEQGDRLSVRELITLSVTLLIAGHENVTNLIGNGVLALASHPDEMERVRARPSLCTDVVAETLRYDGPVTYVPREAATDVRLGATDIAEGEPLVALLGAANRDPAKFEDPGVFRLDRPSRKQHIDFGRGIAYCLGAPLALIEGELALQVLVERLGTFELAVPESELEWRPTVWARGLTNLPIACGR